MVATELAINDHDVAASELASSSTISMNVTVPASEPPSASGTSSQNRPCSRKASTTTGDIVLAFSGLAASTWISSRKAAARCAYGLVITTCPMRCYFLIPANWSLHFEPRRRRQT